MPDFSEFHVSDIDYMEKKTMKQFTDNLSSGVGLARITWPFGTLGGLDSLWKHGNWYPTAFCSSRWNLVDALDERDM